MIVAGELDDHRPARESACQADRAGGGLGAGVDQPDLLDRRHGPDDQLGQFVFGQGRRAETRASMQSRLDGRHHGRVAVAEDHRPPRADVVDVAVAVEVEQVGARGAVEEDRLAADVPNTPRGCSPCRARAAFCPLEGKMALCVRHDGPAVSGHQIAVFPEFTSCLPPPPARD